MTSQWEERLTELAGAVRELEDCEVEVELARMKNDIPSLRTQLYRRLELRRRTDALRQSVETARIDMLRKLHERNDARERNAESRWRFIERAFGG